jgi:[1-hydroxy-2-(trimethylamino)ethyl]phosphonate dioxygenase
MSIIDQLFQLFTIQGQRAYFGESVSETEHALQTAHLAEQAGVDDILIVAALLHDVGHLLHGLPEDIAGKGIDGRHEESGSTWLLNYFGPEVVDPVRLHVAAKRYLCAAEPGYMAELSPASLQSLKLQGGPMTPIEMKEFEQEPHFQSAVAVRRWDDIAKIPGLVVPGLEHYRQRLLDALRTA